MIYITGATGFIGTHLCNKLRQLGTEFTELTRNQTVGDCMAGDQYDGYKDDILIHLAATTTLSTDFNPALFDNNIVYPARLFENFPGRIIYASSTSASELSNPYAYTKRYLECLGEKHGNAVGLRLFNTYGIGNNKGIIKKALECAKDGTAMILSGGDQIRDFVFVDDVVNEFIRAIKFADGIYDVGTGVGTTILSAVETIKQLTKSNFPIIYTPERPQDMKVSISSRSLPYFKPIEEGLLEMI